MRKFSSLDFYDFIYKDKRLSDFGGYVGSNDGGIKTYSLLPSRNYVTDRPLGTNITTVYSSSLEPRPFEVPIVFEEMTDETLSNIAEWLDSPTSSKFQWVGDDVYINAQLDTNDFTISTSSGFDGQMVLKFICFDPFYYNANLTQYTITNLKSGTGYTYKNNGYDELEPYMEIACNGTIKIEILDGNGNVYTTTNITDITSGIKLNSKTQECTLLSGASHFHKIDNFPFLPKGEFTIKVTGSNLTNMYIEYREKFI